MASTDATAQTTEPAPVSAFDRALAAKRSGNYADLARAAKEILGHAEPYLEEPQLLIARELAQKPDYLPQAIEMFWALAHRQPHGSDAEQKILVEIVNYAGGLPNRNDRIKTLRDVARELIDTPFKEQAAAALVKAVTLGYRHHIDRIKELREGARDHIRFPEIERQMTAAFVEQTELLPDEQIHRRISTFRDAALDAVFDSVFERKSVAGFVRNTEKLSDPYERIGAYRKAIYHKDGNLRTGEETLLVHAALSGIIQNAQLLTEASECLDVLCRAADTAHFLSHSKGGLQQQAVSEILMLADNPILEDAQRVIAFRTALRYAEPESDGEAQALQGILKHAPQSSDRAEALSALRKVLAHQALPPEQQMQVIDHILDCCIAEATPAESKTILYNEARSAIGGSPMKQRATERWTGLPENPAPAVPTASAAKRFAAQFAALTQN